MPPGFVLTGVNASRPAIHPHGALSLGSKLITGLKGNPGSKRLLTAVPQTSLLTALRRHPRGRPEYHVFTLEQFQIIGRTFSQNINKSVTLSPRANYTHRATATCRRNLVPTFVDRRVSRGQGGGSLTVVNLSFLARSRYFSFK
jgi:hypothetical protein